ncbi:hypothetical protein N7533_003390 [Penicillium manginii]|jgi:hypothetical protein|uniref:uncharacterized protein n=1 Tax=Penicillium manginii TaxID=203109 RepID=UPI002547D03C|nr:uncharacterized protein N7533_003390 [Penicillium manginii]KAJ5761351.1 hypothetical protein N7533_003390 [Penicillium manginii]
MPIPSTPFAIDILKGPSSKRDTKDLEAGFARRSMMLVRRLLGEDRLIELLAEETVDSSKWWKEISANSNGQWRAARICLSAQGLLSKEFIQWFIPAEGGMLPEPEKLAAHPEHWVVRPSTGSKSMTVLETLGEKPTLFTLAFDVSPPDFVEDEPTFPTKMTGRGYLEDGTQIMELYHQFRDHADGQGFDVDLAIYFPVAAGEDVVECHRQHLLVEFSNWSKQAFEAKSV